MDFDLEDHQPSDSARRRAKSAGLDIEALKRDDPLSYMMLCSSPVVHLAPELRSLAASPLETVMSDQQLFEAETADRVQVLAFPGPVAEQLRRLDQLMGEVVEQVLHLYAYYRVVQDRSGTVRELDLPTAPAEWQGAATMVGPFPDEAQARAWGQERVVPQPGLTYDTLIYAGSWFCDVFNAAQMEA